MEAVGMIVAFPGHNNNNLGPVALKRFYGLGGDQPWTLVVNGSRYSGFGVVRILIPRIGSSMDPAPQDWECYGSRSQRFGVIRIQIPRIGSDTDPDSQDWE